MSVQHGACMLFGGTFEPAYCISLFALPSQVQPITNKRNVVLIQKHMEEALGVSPSRGFLRFVPTHEDHMACNGKTMTMELDDVDKTSDKADDGTLMSRRSKIKNRLSVKVSSSGVSC